MQNSKRTRIAERSKVGLHRTPVLKIFGVNLETQRWIGFNGASFNGRQHVVKILPPHIGLPI